MEGWVKIHRKMLDWQWADDPFCGWVFVNLILMASYEDKEWRGISIKKGQVVTSSNNLAKQTGLNRGQLRGCLNRLKSTNEITSKSTSKYTVITVLNYHLYQAANQQSNQRPTNDEPATNQQLTTSKEVKEVKEVKKLKHMSFANYAKEVSDDVLQYLNLKAGRNFRVVDANVKFISSLLKDGFKKQDLMMVVDDRVKAWLGTKQAEYLRPATLFNKTKFNQYFGNLGASYENSSGIDREMSSVDKANREGEEWLRKTLGRKPASQLGKNVIDGRFVEKTN